MAAAQLPAKWLKELGKIKDQRDRAKSQLKAAKGTRQDVAVEAVFEAGGGAVAGYTLAEVEIKWGKDVAKKLRLAYIGLGIGVPFVVDVNNPVLNALLTGARVFGTGMLAYDKRMERHARELAGVDAKQDAAAASAASSAIPAQLSQDAELELRLQALERRALQPAPQPQEEQPHPVEIKKNRAA